MSKLLTKFLSFGDDKRLRNYQEAVQRINGLEEGLKGLSDDELRAKADQLRERKSQGASNHDLLQESFALIREASKRAIGLRHHDVQLIGAMALDDGCVAEMKTGEGKTLVSTAAGFLNALDGSNVHIVTVNDYLAQRDSEWMGRVYGLLGMDVGLIQNEMKLALRKRAYQAHITYGTNSEFGFDYLRDNMATRVEERVQRGHAYAIVDEVDSILIDEARTPLIISGLGLDAVERYFQFADAVRQLDADDYVMDEKRRTIFVTEAGLTKIEDRLGLEVYADATGQLANHLKQAMTAEYLFHKDNQYVVMDGEVKIVDEFTGRIMEGRRYSEGLHQAIEAKEHVELQPENHTMATVTLQNYFRMYGKLAGMTGTALTEEGEFKHTYGLPVVVVPTNKPVIRDDKADLIFRTAAARDAAVVEAVAKKHEQGQPVLIGTASVDESEKLAHLFRKRGIPHEVLNAKNHAKEAAIIAQAGRKGAVTISTNMAGRGTDILLGGSYDRLYADALAQLGVTEENAEDWQRSHAKGEAEYVLSREGYDVRLFGGLCVIGTQRHESRRIDNQLRGRAGRQGDPGESQFYLSLDDPLLKKFGAERLDAVSDMMVKKGIPDDQPLQDELVSKVIGMAQQQVESMHFATRKNVLEYDDVMDLQRKAIYDERNALLEGKHMDEKLEEIVDDLVDAKVQELCPADLTSDEWDAEALDAWCAHMSGTDDLRLEDVDHDEEPGLVAETVASRFMGKLEAQRDALGEEAFTELCDGMMLNLIDAYWVEHLTDMEHLKKGIGLRSFGHRDPLVEYRNEAFLSFGAMVDAIYEDLVQALMRFVPMPEKPEDAPPALHISAA